MSEAGQIGRRDLATYVAGSALLAASCARAPKEQIVAYGRQPEQTPGVASFYATTATRGGYGVGLLVESHEGRPTKIEGNTDHPASLGGTSALDQAEILALYDPDRLRAGRAYDRPASFAELGRRLGRGASAGLDRVAILSPPTSSTVQMSLLDDAARRGARLAFHDPLPRANVWQGAEELFGRRLDPVYDLTHAQTLVVLDDDLLFDGPFHLRYARQRTAHRRENEADPGRLYVVEPALSITGSVADHRLVTRRSDVHGVAVALLRELARVSPSARGWVAPAPDGLDVPTLRWVRAAAGDLANSGDRALVVAGPAQPPEVHAVAGAVSSLLGSRCVHHVDPVVAAASPERSLDALLTAIDRGEVDLLVILGGNPAYDAPADLDFPRRVLGARERIYLASHDNETARVATWVLPAAHFLESWGDARALDGTVSYQQPLVLPLHGGKTPAELLSLLFSGTPLGGRELLVEQGQRERPDFDRAFPDALQRGVVEGSASAAARVTPTVRRAALDVAPRSQGVELVFRSDPSVGDGTLANVAWLQELPDPITQLTWGNAAMLSEATAARLGVATGDVVDLTSGGRSLVAPVIVAPGQADETAVLTLGRGRAGEESVARGVGFDAGKLRTTATRWFGSGASIARTRLRADLAIAQEHASMEGREPAIDVELGDLRRGAQSLAEKRQPPPTLYELHPTGARQWGMTIDLDACTGCQACVIACQAENNVPVVGAVGVSRGRIMHWLRVDRYVVGEGAFATVRHQPVACVQCEKAPCEYVCPVGATVHSDDGLNDMVYNRCVGTRFCSNNCPYKVRRFNWFDYNRDKPETLRMMMNPDVTVRARGVMEKCTYCVQRIREAEIGARAAGRELRDGDIRTACEQACPSVAITFGDIKDPASRVARLRDDPRAYELLHELGTLPRTRHLARIDNPNAELGP